MAKVAPKPPPSVATSNGFNPIQGLTDDDFITPNKQANMGPPLASPLHLPLSDKFKATSSGLEGMDSQSILGLLSDR